MECATVSTKPLTREETKTLLDFIESSKVIYNKTTNATTNKMKTEEWIRIAGKFNAVVTTSYRTPQQLRLKWENLKKNARKRRTQIRMNNIKTGGGGPDYIPPDDLLDRVATLLGSTVEGFTVAFGGDAELVPDLVNGVGGVGNEIDTGLVGVTSLHDNAGLEIKNIKTADEVLVNCIVTDTITETCLKTTPISKTYLNTPRASGFKRKTNSDENRSARNLSIANYYNIKAKVLEANLENIMLENKKLKLELKKLQNED